MFVLVALLSGRSRLRSARYAMQARSLVNIGRDVQVLLSGVRWWLLRDDRTGESIFGRGIGASSGDWLYLSIAAVWPLYLTRV